MQKPLIVYESLWRNGEIIAVSSENPEFPAENTQDDSPQIYWRSVDVAGAITIDIDLGSDRDYDFVSLRGHNLTGVATIKVIGADDDAFTVNVVTDALGFYGNNLSEKLAATRTKRYVRISLTDAANPSGYLQVGTIVLGKAFSINRRPGIPVQDGFESETAVESSLAGVEFVVEEGPMRRVRRLIFRVLNDISAAVIRSLIESCWTDQGWLLCLDYDDTNATTEWVKLREAGLPSSNHENNVDFDMEIGEVL